jgi:glycosyltransferase involved in cell wall biosynthesis
MLDPSVASMPADFTHHGDGRGAQSTGLDVLHVIPSLGAGGAERILAMLVSAPRATPLRQRVVHFRRDDEMAGLIHAAGVATERIPIEQIWDIPAAVFRLGALIRRTRPAAIQSWQYYADLVSLCALRLSGRGVTTRLYWGIRCSDIHLDDYPWRVRWAVAACVRCAAAPTAVVANSYAGRDAHLRFGYAPRRFLVIPNGIDAVRFAPNAEACARIRGEFSIAPTERVVIHVARIDPMKDHASLIAVAQAMPGLRFWAVGKGTEELTGPANLRGLGLRHDVPRLLAASDFMLSTSRYGEGSSNAVAEAMAVGLPVVATDVGDARRIIGDAGAVVPPGDRTAMIAALTRLCQLSDQERAAIGTRARERVLKYYDKDSFVAAFDALHRADAVDDHT